MSQFKRGRVLPTSPCILVSPQTAAHDLLEGRILVCLIRHGQTDWNLIKRLQGQDVPFAEYGKKRISLFRYFFGTEILEVKRRNEQKRKH